MLTTLFKTKKRQLYNLKRRLKYAFKHIREMACTLNTRNFALTEFSENDIQPNAKILPVF